MSRLGWIFAAAGAVAAALAFRGRERLREVYRREVASGAKPIEAVGTAIAAFVGSVRRPP